MQIRQKNKFFQCLKQTVALSTEKKLSKEIVLLQEANTMYANFGKSVV